MIKPLWTSPVASAAPNRISMGVSRMTPTFMNRSTRTSPACAASSGIAWGFSMNLSIAKRMSRIIAGANNMTTTVPARIMIQLLTSRELAT